MFPIKASITNMSQKSFSIFGMLNKSFSILIAINTFFNSVSILFVVSRLSVRDENSHSILLLFVKSAHAHIIFSLLFSLYFSKIVFCVLNPINLNMLDPIYSKNTLLM